MVLNTYNTSKIKVSEQFVYPLSVHKLSASTRNAQQLAYGHRDRQSISH